MAHIVWYSENMEEKQLNCIKNDLNIALYLQ